MPLSLLLALADAPSFAVSHRSYCRLTEAAVDHFVAVNEREPKPAKATLVPDANGKTIFDLCPSARAHLPATFSIVAAPVHRGPDVFSPTLGFNADSFVHELGVPRLTSATDATVAIGYSCDGLCGGSLVEAFAFANGRWSFVKRVSGWVS